MKTLYRYSPLPPDRYWLPGTSQCEVRILQGSLHASALWNLFWLSNPGIDKVPKTGPQWYRHYRPVDGLLSAVVRDVHYDAALACKLDMHPEMFLEFFERDDHSIYECYQRFGKPWVETVRSRADAAVVRMLSEKPPIVISGSTLTITPHLN